MGNMVFGYARVSTQDQELARQIDALGKYGVDEIFTEKMTGTKSNRPELNRLKDKVRPGDTVVIESLSRLGRSTKDLLSLIEDWNHQGVKLVSLKEAIDTTTPTGKFMLTIFGAVAELEREYILQRQREGIEIAKTKGVYKGRKPIERPDFQHIVSLWRKGEFTAVEAMKRLDMKPRTFYRRVKAVQWDR